MSSSSTTNAPPRKPSDHSVIHDGIYKNTHLIGGRANLVSVRRLSASASNVHDETTPMEQSAPSSSGVSNTDGASEMDEDGVDRPEDLCELSSDEWDVEEAGWTADDCAAAEDATPASYIQLEDFFQRTCGVELRQDVWSATDYCQRTSSGQLRELLWNDAAPASDFEDDAACMWAAPQCVSFQRFRSL